VRRAAQAVLALFALGVVWEASGVGARSAPAPAVKAPAPRPTPVRVAAPPAPKPEPTPELVVRRVLDTGGPIAFGKWFWDDAGVPPGPLVITVDLAAQTLSAFRGGYEIGTAAILYGADEKPTPLGVYPISQKDADHVSNLYGAPMPYMLRMTNDGVSIHGTEVAWGYATHGCVGIPVAFARKLFAAAKLGDRVIVTRGRMIGVGQPIA
jgi:lipoprotein-anchoring transpeptidase ErfK/SrfK